MQFSICCCNNPTKLFGGRTARHNGEAENVGRGREQQFTAGSEMFEAVEEHITYVATAGSNMEGK